MGQLLLGQCSFFLSFLSRRLMAVCPVLHVESAGSLDLVSFLKVACWGDAYSVHSHGML